jgi:uncharacterized membrane protein YkoI
MKHMRKYIAVGLITAGVAGTVYTVQAKVARINDALGVTTANVTLGDAVGLASRIVPGTPVAAQFEDEAGKAVWKVEILASDQTVHDLDIDAASGDVLKNRVDKPDHEDEESDD